MNAITESLKERMHAFIHSLNARLAFGRISWMLINQDENFLTTFHRFLPTFSQFSYYFAVLVKGKVYNLAVYLRRKVYASKENPGKM